MCLDLFSEQTPCDSILVNDHLPYKRPLSLCVLGGRLREVRLYLTLPFSLASRAFVDHRLVTSRQIQT